MVGNIVSQHKRNSLAFVYLDLTNKTFANHAWFGHFFEGNVGTSFAIFSLLKDDV